MSALRRLWAWLSLRSKAKPVVTPWPQDRHDTIQADEFWEVMDAHHRQDVRRGRALVATVVAFMAPYYGVLFAETFTKLVGAIVGGGTAALAGVIAAYNRE